MNIIEQSWELIMQIIEYVQNIYNWLFTPQAILTWTFTPAYVFGGAIAITFIIATIIDILNPL